MGMRIRAIRKQRNLTGEQLAEMVGVSKGYISELENGKKTPGASLTLRLADALKVEIYELYDGPETDQRAAAMRAHMDVMAQLPPEDRQTIERIALGLLAKHP